MAILSKIQCRNAKCGEILHPWTTSCSYATLEIFYHVFRTSFRIYGTIYLIATLLRKKGWDYVKSKLLPEILQSTTFLSLNGSLFAAFLCLLRKLLGTFTIFTSGFLPAALASYLAILVERPERRGLLALYMFNNAIEAIFNSLVRRNIISTISYGEVYMFCMASGLLMYLYRGNQLNNGFLNSIIKFLIKEEKSQGNVNPSHARTLQNTYPTITLQYVYKRLLSPLRAFTMGYLIQAVPGILKSIFQPMQIPRILVQKNNFKLALFLGSFVSIFQLVEHMLTVLRKKQDSYNSFIAGSASGMSMLLYRSSTISLYLFTKVAEILFKNAQYQGLIPFIPYTDIIMYSLSTAMTFHMCIFEKNIVRPSYWRFISHCTNQRIEPASEMFPKLFLI